MTDAVLFDLDCTLTDRAASVRRFAEQFVAFYGDAFDGGAPDVHPGLPSRAAEVITAADGFGYAPRTSVCDALAARLPWRRPPGDLLAYWKATFPGCTVVRPDAAATLAALRAAGLRLAVVSNGAADTQRRKLAAAGLADAVDAVVISGEVGLRKPDAAIFRLAMDRVGAGAAWFVGDHPTLDVDGARRAGLTAVWMAGIHPWPATVGPADRSVYGLREVVPMVLDAP